MADISGVSTRIEFNPTDPTELPRAVVQARVQIAALKTEQDMMLLQTRELSRLLEPHKGGSVDARA